MTDRIAIFRNDFSELSSFDDEQAKQMILLYDHNLVQGHTMSDPAINLIGGLLIWAGWLFMTCAAGYEIVEFDHESVPQLIATNTMVSGSSAGVTFALFDYLEFQVHHRMRVQDPQGILNAVLSGLVAISGSCNNVTFSSSCIIGSIAAIIGKAVNKLCVRYKIDDPVRHFEIYGGSGVWGCLAVGIFD